jgi:hypothetical protein
MQVSEDFSLRNKLFLTFKQHQREFYTDKMTTLKVQMKNRSATTRMLSGMIFILLASGFSPLFAQDTKKFSDTEAGKIWSVELPKNWQQKKIFAVSDSSFFVTENSEKFEDKVSLARFGFKKVKLPPLPEEWQAESEEDRVIYYLAWRRKIFLQERGANFAWLEYDNGDLVKGNLPGSMTDYEYQIDEKTDLVRARTYFLIGKKFCFEITFEAEDETWNDLSDFFKKSFESMTVAEL